MKGNTKLLVFLLVLCFTANCAAAECIYSISDVYAETRHGWSGSFDTVRGETINVELSSDDISVPPIEKAPVVLVSDAKIPPIPEERLAEFYQRAQAEPNGNWAAYNMGNGRLIVGWNGIARYPASSSRKPSDREYGVTIRFDLDDWDAYYAEDCALTLREAVVMNEKLIETYIGDIKYTLSYGYTMGPVRKLLNRKTDLLGESFGGVGEYIFTNHGTFYGMPYSQSIVTTYQDAIGRYKRETPLNYNRFICTMIGSDDCFDLIAYWFEEEELFCDDIKLCSFDDVMTSLAAYIEDGHIRTIYGADLELVLFLDPEKDDVFWAVPSWVVQCQYARTAKGTIHVAPRFNEPEQWDSGTVLVVNAQTGEVYDPLRTDSQRSVRPDIIQ